MKWVFLVVYIATIAVVSVISSRKVKNLDDFHLGGRSIGPWLSAFAYGTTYFSSVIFVGYAGKLGWNFGTAAVWIGIGNALLGSALAWQLLGNKTRKLTRELKVSTMPEFFEKRYDSKTLKIMAALVIFVFLTPYSASVYQGLGYLFESAFGIPFEVCMLVMAGVTLCYLLLGGYMATVLTDFVQGLFMIVGVCAMIFFLFKNMGGLGSAMEQLEAYAPANVTLFGGAPLDLLWLVLLTSFGVWGLPQMVHKFYAIKDEKSVKAGTVISTLFALVIGFCAYFAGAFGRVMLSNQVPVDAATGLANYDMIIPQMLLASTPELVLGLIVVLILSASMSTLASLVMVSSSAIAIDLFKGVLFKNMKENRVKLWMKLLCAAFVVISLVIAFQKDTPIVSLMSFSWGTVAGCILGPYVMGVLWKGTNRAGAIAGFVAGLVVSLALPFLLATPEAPFTAHTSFAGVMAMVASAVVTPVVSLLTRPQSVKLQGSVKQVHSSAD